jgi:hypothetical protein
MLEFGIYISMNRKLFVNCAGSLLILALLFSAARAQSQSAARYLAGSGYLAPTLTLFQNEQQAQKYCSQDTVVLARSFERHLSFQGSTLVRQHQQRCHCL